MTWKADNSEILDSGFAYKSIFNILSWHKLDIKGGNKIPMKHAVLIGEPRTAPIDVLLQGENSKLLGLLPSIAA